MGTPETSREPCPDRILDDLGGAFGMGAVGGSFFHFVRGMYSSPKGERFLGGTTAVRMNAPRVGGSFAVWGGLFSMFDCSMVYLRQKEDPWNSIVAGAAAGGFLQMRQGLRSAGKSAALGGVLLALIEGAGIALNKFTSPPPQTPVSEEEMAMMMQQQQQQQQGGGFGGIFGNFGGGVPQPVPQTGMGMNESSSTSDSSSGSGFFGGWFGGKKEEKRGSKTEVLESFDAPIPPSFEYK